MREHSLDSLAEGVGAGGGAGAHTGHLAEVSSAEKSEAGGGVRVSDSLCVARWNPGSAHPPAPTPCNPKVNTLGVT